MNPPFDRPPELSRIWERLSAIHRHWLWRRALSRLATAVGIAAALFWLAVVVEYAWGLPVAARWAIVGTLAALVSVGLGLFIRAWMGRVPYRRRALDLERYDPSLREQLVTAVEMADGRELERRGYADWLYRHTVAEALGRLEALDLSRFWTRAGLARGLRWAGLGLGFSALLALAFPTPAGRTLFALANPATEIPRPVPFTWQIEAGRSPVLQYDDVTLEARATGAKPPVAATLSWRYDGESQWFSEAVNPEPGSEGVRFAHTLSAVPQSLVFRFEADGRTSTEGSVTVVRRPELTGIEAVCRPPAYTGTREFKLESADHRWVVPEGSRIELVAKSDRPLASGRVEFQDSAVTPLAIDGHEGRASWRVNRAQRLRVFVVDTANFSNFDPVPIDVDVVEDLAPQVAFLEPGRDRDIPDAMVVPMALALLDDYGFSKVEMIFTISGQDGDRPERAMALALPKTFGREGVFGFNWSLADARLFPGDRVIYRARAYDNDEPQAKWTETESFVLRLPTLDEMIAETERNQSERTDKVAEAVLQQQKLALDLRQMARELVGKDKVEWEDRQQAEQALAQQEQLAKDLEKWADDIEKEAQKLADQRMTSLEVLQKMNEISQILRDVMTPEMKAALEKLRLAMESLSPEEMKQALDQFQMNEEELLAQLDRALAQLRQMQLEQMMENMLRKAEQLAANQEQQNRATEQAADQRALDSMARVEEALKDELSELQKKAGELSEKSKEYGGPPQVEKFAQTVQNTEAGMDMKDMSSQMKSGDPKGASQSGQSASKKLRDMLAGMQQQMMGMRSQMSAEQMQKLRDLAQRGIELSQEQESIGDSVGNVSPQSLALRDLAARQLALKSGIEQLLSDVTEEAQKNLFLKPEVRQYLKRSCDHAGQAVGALIERNGGGSQSFQYESMFSLNDASRTLLESLDNQSQCQGQAPGQGKMHEGMQGLAQQQMQLNQQSEGMRNPFGLSEAEQQAVKRLSAQQQQIQREMQELGEQFAQSRDRLGRVDEMARSMDEVIEDLSAGALTDETLERQRKIYNRMLDFQKSLQRQDYENRRQSREGSDLAGRDPGALGRESAAGAESARWEKFKNEWYPARFRSLIKDYFESVSRPAEPAR
jgi:hypothetical protein